MNSAGAGNIESAAVAVATRPETPSAGYMQHGRKNLLKKQESDWHANELSGSLVLNYS